MNTNTTSFFFIIFFSFFMNFFSAHGEESLYEIEGKKIIYEDGKNLIIASGDAYAKDQFGKKIYADKIIYNKEKLTILTTEKSIYLDGKGNKLEANNFFYDLKLKKIKASGDVNYFSNTNDHFKFSVFEYYEDVQRGSGKNFSGLLADKSSLEGAFAKIDQIKGILIVNQDKSGGERNAYTSCENEKGLTANILEKCPDWSITSSKTTHDQNKKMIYHKNVFVNIKNIPLFYTPYFSHPDPSVKRKSGFLPPSIKNFTDLGRSVKAPYFLVVDENKDFTFTPIYYMEEHPIFLGEYRQKNKNSEFYIDTSYSQGYKELNKKSEDGTLIERTGGSRNHFFFNFLGNYDDLVFASNDLTINIQKISQKNYLKVNQINTTNIKQNIESLENNIILNSYENNKQLVLEAYVYENINEENHSKKYQYTMPSIRFSNFFKKFNQSINITNDFSAKNLGENINKVTQTNQINSTSDLKRMSAIQGMGSLFKTSIKNKNIYNENVKNSKENLNNDIYLTLAMENSYPLVKYKNNTEETISPKIFSKYTTGSMENASDQSKILNYQDVFSMDRNNASSNIETGASVGYGVEYNINKKNLKNEIYLDAGFSIGQILKKNTLKEMPKNSSLQEKKSDYVGTSSFKVKSQKFNNSELNLNYNYILNNNLNAFLKNEIVTSFTNDSNKLTISFNEESKIGNSHYVETKYQKKFENNLSFLIGLRKNLQADFTESNFIGTNYESDCLKIDLSLSKIFYNNKDLRPSSNLMFSITLKPFGSPIAPDLSSFVKQYD
jgi:LPS-assembly protein